YTQINPTLQHLILTPEQHENLYYFLLELNTYVNEYLTFNKETTDVKSTANDSLELKSGVCQDYTHIFIGMCRYNGIPACYVSGYLNQGMDFVGSTLMHAWVEAFIPGVGWVGFDPTNNLLVNEHYIKVSHGA